MPALALVDCNSFYASCERVFNPRLNGQPVVVLSNNDGCIIARTDEAKALGIKMGEPFFKARGLIERNGVQVFSSNYALYADMSQRAMAVLNQFTPNMEIYSIDEAFLSLDGFGHLNLTAYGQEIRSRVSRWTGLPVSVGVGATKTLAKLANRYAKKRREFMGVCDLHNLSVADMNEILEETPLVDIWGIGHRLASRLTSAGIHNARELRDAPPKQMRNLFGVVLERTVMELRGIACLRLDEISQPRKEIVVSRSFAKPVIAKEDLSDAACRYAIRAAEKLRRQQSVTKTLSVFAHTSLFNPNDPHYGASTVIRMSDPTSDTRTILKAVRQGIEHIFRPGYRYVKTGVMLHDLLDASAVQPSLLNSHSKQSTTLMRTVDAINARMGTNTIGGSYSQPPWQMQRQRLSPAFTTRWSDVLVVKAR